MDNHTIIVVNPDLKIEELVKIILKRPEKQLILEVPEKTAFLTNEINLRLIKFYAEDEDKELIINAVDPVLVSLAQRLGISTIRERSLDVTGHSQQQEVAATTPPKQSQTDFIPKRPRRKRVKHRHTPPRTTKGFLPAVVVAIGSLMLGIWLFIQPKAVIIVYPKEQKLNFSAKAEVSPDYRDQDIVTGKIPAKVVEKIGELSVQTATTGKKVIGITPATGKVILINSSMQPVVVPKGSVIISENGVRYQTGKNVLVPRKITRTRYGIPVGEEYGKVEVPVIALEKGSQGNQPAKSIRKIEGKFQKFLQVVNLEPLSNGIDQRLPVVAAADCQKGQTEATNQMRLVAPEDLAAMVGEGYLYLPELVELKVLNLSSTPEVGTEAATVKTYLKYRAAVVVPSTAGINKFLKNQLDANLPAGFEMKDNEVKLVSAQVLSSRLDNVNLNLIGSATLRGVLSQSKVKELVKGKSITEAKQIMTGQNEISEFKIETKDPKSRYLPRFGFQIKVLFPAGGQKRVIP